eukprot:5146502-Ditylum_brightwellii.AAC.1
MAGKLGEQGLSLGKNMPWVMKLEQASKNRNIAEEGHLCALDGNHIAQEGEGIGDITDGMRLDWNKASNEFYTCLFGKSNDIALTNNDRNDDNVEYSFIDERISAVLRFDNCCTNHICGVRKLFKELREAPVGKGVLGIGGASKPKGIGTIVFQVTDDEGR